MDAAEQRDYDNHTKHLRSHVRTLMDLGSDKPSSTASDILDVVGSLLREEYDIDIDRP